MNQILQRFLTLGLRVQEFLFLLEKLAVVAMNAKRTIGINPIEFDHVRSDVLQEITVMADDHAGKCRSLKQVFEPRDSGKIEMVGGLVEQQNVGMLHQCLDNGQPFLPAAR